MSDSPKYEFHVIRQNSFRCTSELIFSVLLLIRSRSPANEERRVVRIAAACRVGIENVDHIYHRTRPQYVENLNEKINKGGGVALSMGGLLLQIVDIVALKTAKLRRQAWVVSSDVPAASIAVRRMQKFHFYNKPMRHRGYNMLNHNRTYDKKKKQEDRAKRKKRVDDGQQPATANGQRVDSNGGPASSARPARLGTQNSTAVPKNLLFLGNVSHETSSMMLELLFKQYPGFREVRMVVSKPGIAFCSHAGPSRLQNYCLELNGYFICQEMSDLVICLLCQICITPQNQDSCIYSRFALID